MNYWKLLLGIFVVIFIGGCVYLYILTSPEKPVATVTTPTTTPSTDNSYFGQSTQTTTIVPVTPEAQATDPSEFTKNFYAWYLDGFKNITFSRSDKFKSEINNWLTPDFLQNWSAITQDSGSDPVLLAQDYFDSWITNMQTSITTQTATTSTVMLTLGTSSQKNILSVSLVKHDTSWRIDSVSRGK
jgi:hypothetical protein